MRTFILGAVVALGLVALGWGGVALANGVLEGDTPAILVSPSTIVLVKVDTVSVHTNIPATAVDAGSLALDGVAPTGVYVDSLGHIAAKFAVADLGLAPGQVTLTLSGLFNDGEAFLAADSVTVK